MTKKHGRISDARSREGVDRGTTGEWTRKDSSFLRDVFPGNVACPTGSALGMETGRGAPSLLLGSCFEFDRRTLPGDVRRISGFLWQGLWSAVMTFPDMSVVVEVPSICG